MTIQHIKMLKKTRYMYYYTNFDSSYDSDDEYMGESRLYNDSFDYVENEADVLTSLQKQSIADYGNSKARRSHYSSFIDINEFR